MEEVEIEVWWPKDTGPFRHRADKPREQTRRQSFRARESAAVATPAEGGEAVAAKPEGEPRRDFRPRRDNRPKREDRPEGQAPAAHVRDDQRNPRREGGKPTFGDRKPKFESPKFEKPKFEKPMDPNSPFAVLGALKFKLAGK